MQSSNFFFQKWRTKLRKVDCLALPHQNWRSSNKIENNWKKVIFLIWLWWWWWWSELFSEWYISAACDKYDLWMMMKLTILYCRMCWFRWCVLADLPDCLSPSIMTYPFCVEVQEDDDDDDNDGIDDDKQDSLNSTNWGSNFSKFFHDISRDVWYILKCLDHWIEWSNCPKLISGKHWRYLGEKGISA